jgi:hypothetical protein
MGFYFFSDNFVSVAVAIFVVSTPLILVVVVRSLFLDMFLILRGFHHLLPRLQVVPLVVVVEKAACLFLVDFLTGEVKDKIDLVTFSLDCLRLFECLNYPWKTGPC